MQGMYKRGWAGHTSDRAFSAAMMAYLQGYDEAQTRTKFAFLELGRSKVDTVRRSPPHMPSPLPPRRHAAENASTLADASKVATPRTALLEQAAGEITIRARRFGRRNPRCAIVIV
jgi:hypothetical protein